MHGFEQTYSSLRWKREGEEEEEEEEKEEEKMVEEEEDTMGSIQGCMTEPSRTVKRKSDEKMARRATKRKRRRW